VRSARVNLSLSGFDFFVLHFVSVKLSSENGTKTITGGYNSQSVLTTM
jgi:hypothetical protein